VSHPTFGDASEYNPFGKTVSSTDVAVGSAIGLIGGGFVAYLGSQVWPMPPAFVVQYSQPISSVIAGYAAYTLLRKKSKPTAEGYLAGAVITAIVPALYQTVKSMLPAQVAMYFGDPVVAHPKYGDPVVAHKKYSGFIQASPRMAGFIQASPRYAGLLQASPRLAGSNTAMRAMGIRR